MSMTGKTSNELFPVGQNTDTVSIFDINVITEKADMLIHELQGKDSLTASELEEVKTKLTQLTQGLTTVTQTAGTNATNIASLQNSIDSLNKNLANYCLTKGMYKVVEKEFNYTIKPNNGITINITPDSIDGYACIGVVKYNTGDYNTYVVTLSPTTISLCNKGAVEVSPKGYLHLLYLRTK